MQMEQFIPKTVNQYQKISLWVVCAMALVCLLALQIADLKCHIYSVMFSSVYQLVTNRLSIVCWRAIMRVSPAVIGRFYMGVSALRIILGMVVIIVGVFLLREQRPMMMGFVIIFSLFYISSLVFETAFFSFIESKKHITKQ
jgi:hypothetical protein